MKNEILKTEKAISFVKETFTSELSKKLKLTLVSSPIVILDGTGINDDLNGVERIVKIPIKSLDYKCAVIVNSLAKWKRIRLKELGIMTGKGILTNMIAIRPDEDYSPIHSIYVDQWDWEKRIKIQDRTLAKLKDNVKHIYKALKTTEMQVAKKYSYIKPILPDQIAFIHSEELLQRYSQLSAKERETKITKKYGAVFIIGIGGKLSNGEIHDDRAPDYDDWSTKNSDGYIGLNGDIIIWNPVIKSAFEISSMGIRVDKKALLKQLEKRECLDRKKLMFHKMILNDQLQQSIGGGIGQSRVCMFLLRKKHIGEVQVGIWPDFVKKECKVKGIYLF